MARGVVKKGEGKSKDVRKERAASNQRNRYFGRLKTPMPSELLP
jgi:hypothetical protein